MTVSLDDGSPERLLQQSAAPEPALPGALRTMIQTVLQETLAAQFATFLGAAPYERDDSPLRTRLQQLAGDHPRWGAPLLTWQL